MAVYSVHKLPNIKQTTKTKAATNKDLVTLCLYVKQ